MRTLTTLVFLPMLLASAHPARATVADDLCPAAQDPCVVNTTITLTPGSVIDLAGRALQLGAAARVTVGAGQVQILAGPVTLLAGARITGATGVAPSTLEIDSTGSIALQGTGSTRSRIDLSGTVQGGTITLNAGGAITAAGDIVSDGNGTEASGGVIMLTSAAGDFLVSGSLSSNGGSDAGGGFISLVAQGGKIDIAQPVDLSGGEFDGGELDLTASGDVIVRQEINVSGGGLSGSGGTVFITAGGAATLLGNIDGTAAGSSDEGGGDGADVEIDANQDVVVSGPIDVTGGFPDGSAGTFFSTAGGNFTQTQKITLFGNGIDACGGEMDVNAGRNITLVQIEAGGGSCGGGDVSAQGLGTTTAGAAIHADGGPDDGGGDAGTIDLEGRDVLTNDVVRANAGTSLNAVGQITAGGLQRDGGQVQRDSDPGWNRGTGAGFREPDPRERQGQHPRQAADDAARPRTPSRYRDPAMPPAISGTVTPSAIATLDPTLPPCPGATAACGDGNLDPGEQCDDGNNVSCDGCNAACQIEALRQRQGGVRRGVRRRPTERAARQRVRRELQGGAAAGRTPALPGRPHPELVHGRMGDQAP